MAFPRWLLYLKNLEFLHWINPAKIWAANWGGKIGLILGMILGIAVFWQMSDDKVIEYLGLSENSVHAESFMKFLSDAAESEAGAETETNGGELTLRSIVAALLSIFAGIAGVIIGGLIKIIIKKVRGKKESVERQTQDDGITYS